MEIAERMKSYESAYSMRTLPLIPTMVRIDGKTFHTWTKNLETPFDKRLSNIFIETTRFLVEKTNAKLGYTQSDEITLMYYTPNTDKQIFFDRKLQKMNSVLSSMATAFFNQKVSENIPEKKDQLAFFDSRVWSVPNLEEAANVFLWRELDAIRNSVFVVGRSYFSHKQLHGKKQGDLKKMLLDKGVDWDKDFPDYLKRGTYIARKLKEGTELSRHVWTILDIPFLINVSNKVDVLFENQEPILKG